MKRARWRSLQNLVQSRRSGCCAASAHCCTIDLMPKTRANHYVPQWYQDGFIEAGRTTLKYLDLDPDVFARSDGTTVRGRALFDSPTSRAFYTTDLYSTFFGFHIDDEIERKLFGDIDTRGSQAVRAFQATDVAKWVERFSDLFEFIDAQKLRTPKGLDWLQHHYPALDQNQLMAEMQGLRMMHCTLWSEGVREIVSAEHSDVKFIVSDHPVTIYNHAVPPSDLRSAYPNDPPIAWKASQTIFTLDQSQCLIISNLEYAQDPTGDPCAKRTHARNFRPTLVRADALIRTRQLTGDQVAQVNYVLKSRSKRYIAAGREEWLYPERRIDVEWSSIRSTMLPPNEELWRFGGETYVRYEDGRVDYSDAFGRTEPRAEFLSKPDNHAPKSPNAPCGCGSGRKYGRCCSKRKPEFRPSWSELSIRERNILHYNAITNIIGLTDGLDWTEARRGLTDAKIVEIHRVFRALWPTDTDLLSLLPKPDGRLRALFTGIVDPRTLIEFALGSANYFGEILIQSPFIHDAFMNPEYSPIQNPRQYHQEIVKHVALLLDLMPLINAGVVSFFPDPCSFDRHLRSQMMRMATERSEPMRESMKPDPRTEWLQKDDFHRSILSMPERVHLSMMRRAAPEAGEALADEAIAMARDTRHLDPLSPLSGATAKEGAANGQLLAISMAPNLEMSLYLAQATGSIIVTDNPHRWRELTLASWWKRAMPSQILPRFIEAIESEEHYFLGDADTILSLDGMAHFHGYKSLIHDVFRYVTARPGDTKPNWESQLPKRLARANSLLRKAVMAADRNALCGKVQCIIPANGLRDNTVNRLLLMTSVDHYLESVPMAFFIERPDPSSYSRAFPSMPWQ